MSSLVSETGKTSIFDRVHLQHSVRSDVSAGASQIPIQRENSCTQTEGVDGEPIYIDHFRIGRDFRVRANFSLHPWREIRGFPSDDIE
jgi:hypothetical protein